MRGFRGRYDAFGFDEIEACLKTACLVLRNGFNEPVFEELANKHPGTVVAQATRVYRWRNEIVSQCIHGQALCPIVRHPFR